MRRALQQMGAGSVSARIGEVPKICQLVRAFSELKPLKFSLCSERQGRSLPVRQEFHRLCEGIGKRRLVW